MHRITCARARTRVCVCHVYIRIVQCAQSGKQTIKGKKEKERERVLHSGIRGSINLNFHQNYFQLCVAYQRRFEIEGKQRFVKRSLFYPLRSIIFLLTFPLALLRYRQLASNSDLFYRLRTGKPIYFLIRHTRLPRH